MAVLRHMGYAIDLSKEEADHLKNLFGQLRLEDVKDVVGSDSGPGVFKLTEKLYYMLADSIKEEI